MRVSEVQCASEQIVDAQVSALPAPVRRRCDMSARTATDMKCSTRKPARWGGWGIWSKLTFDLDHWDCWFGPLSRLI